jgi:hypothetical protein
MSILRQIRSALADAASVTPPPTIVAVIATAQSSFLIAFPFLIPRLAREVRAPALI